MNQSETQNNEVCLEVLKALAHPIRMRIVEMLAFDRKEFTVGEMQEILGEEQAVVSHQLGVLKSRGIVSFRKDGRSRIYALANDRYRKLIQSIKECAKSQE